MIDAALFKSGMRRLAAGVCLVTATDRDGLRQGLVATSVISVTVEPPSLLVCVNKAASCHDPIANSGAFCVNLLADADDEVARRFGSSAARDSRFADRQWRALETGAPRSTALWRASTAASRRACRSARTRRANLA